MESTAMDLSALNSLLPRNVQIVIAWCGVLIVLAGIPFALGRLWTFFKTVSHRFNTYDTLVPVILDIGSQFKKNSGSSLKDVIDGITRTLQDSGKQLDHLKEMAETSAANSEAAKKEAQKSAAISEGISNQFLYMLKEFPELHGRVLEAVHANKEIIEKSAAAVPAVMILNDEANPVAVKPVDRL
ncbi:MAG: hypothetical protein LC772_06670 [Chloroflexi bacterium]|nr:hypothetical protein [Chloroflexota bacterium]